MHAVTVLANTLKRRVDLCDCLHIISWLLHVRTYSTQAEETGKRLSWRGGALLQLSVQRLLATATHIAHDHLRANTVSIFSAISVCHLTIKIKKRERITKNYNIKRVSQALPFLDSVILLSFLCYNFNYYFLVMFFLLYYVI